MDQKFKEGYLRDIKKREEQQTQKEKEFEQKTKEAEKKIENIKRQLQEAERELGFVNKEKNEDVFIPEEELIRRKVYFLSEIIHAYFKENFDNGVLLKYDLRWGDCVGSERVGDRRNLPKIDQEYKKKYFVIIQIRFGWDLQKSSFEKNFPFGFIDTSVKIPLVDLNNEKIEEFGIKVCEKIHKFLL